MERHDVFSASVYPLNAQWDAPRSIWHASYPPGVPPALDFTPLRTDHLLRLTAERYPDRTAVWYFHTKWTYTELVARVQQAAANLAYLGIKPGDRVLVVLPNCPEFVVSWLALHWMGAEVVPANPLLNASDLERLIRLCNCRAVIGLDLRLEPVLGAVKLTMPPVLLVASLARHLPLAMRLPYRMRCWIQGSLYTIPGTTVFGFDELEKPLTSPLGEGANMSAKETAILQPTGGTTGHPKVAQLTHANLHENVAQLHVWSGLAPGDELVLGILPFFHAFGATVALLSSIASGSTLLMLSRFHPGTVWKTMETRKPGVVPMVPFMIATLCREMRRRGRNLEGLKLCFSGAAPLAPELKDEFESRTGAIVIEGYGLSEASPVTHTNVPSSTAKQFGIGLPLPGTLAKIVDTETGERELAPGEVGELILSGPQVMSGYYDSPGETRRTLRNGWLHTGDLASMTDDGFFTIVDRKKDLIISGGLNVYPGEVEAILEAHPAVEECAVVGVPDELYGEAIAAFIVLRKGQVIPSEQLQAHCRAGLAAYKVPRIITICDALPKNILGKVRRVELRTRVA